MPGNSASDTQLQLVEKSNMKPAQPEVLVSRILAIHDNPVLPVLHCGRGWTVQVQVQVKVSQTLPAALHSSSSLAALQPQVQECG